MQFLKSNPYITKDILYTIALITREDPNVIITGSVALTMWGLLDRPLGDLDVFTSKDYYNNPLIVPMLFFRKRGHNENSEIVEVRGHKVKVFNIKPSNTVVDVMYSPSLIEAYAIVSYQNTLYKIKYPESIIAAKVDNLIHTMRHANYLKNIVDLKRLGVAQERLNYFINKANLTKDHEERTDGDYF